jgi:hypothetical protein
MVANLANTLKARENGKGVAIPSGKTGVPGGNPCRIPVR